MPVNLLHSICCVFFIIHQYIFNLMYQEEAACMLEFIQRYFNGINPERDQSHLEQDPLQEDSESRTDGGSLSQPSCFNS
ncbi:hypothetical protein GOODEAATRI_011897 [Goodea atripinnis]|uniref:Uncharacterized protein n=1 Tax=Goodea atripinnis TaxID=208336 RepID=A0ABV0P3F5_9TELE